ncbi:MAG: outer membrane protein assembly factor BamE [Azovibrio sp.]
MPRVVTEYRIDVQQGNVLTQNMVSQLTPGLSRDQVKYILGTPLLTDVFHEDRWDYAFRLQEGKTGEVTMRQFSVFFDETGTLTKVTGDVEVGSVEELTAPTGQTQVVDMGSLGDEEVPLPPVEDEGGFVRGIVRSLGL